MPAKRKALPAKSVRQSVTMPATLAAVVRRVARERHLTMSRALVALAESGVHAEAQAATKARRQLKAAPRNALQKAGATPQK